MIYDNIILIEYTIIYDRYGSADFFFHFPCPLGPKSLYLDSRGSTTKLKTLCVKFINNDSANYDKIKTL